MNQKQIKIKKGIEDDVKNLKKQHEYSLSQRIEEVEKKRHY